MTSRITALATGTILGAAIWLSSPVLTDKYEPWDSSWGYLLAALAIVGFVAGIICGRKFWLATIGIYTGQLAVMILRPQPNAMESGPYLYTSGVILLALFTLMALGTSALGFLIRRKNSKINRDPQRPSASGSR